MQELWTLLSRFTPRTVSEVDTGPDVWTLTGRGEARDNVRFALQSDIGVAVVSQGFGSFSGGGLSSLQVVNAARQQNHSRRVTAASDAVARSAIALMFD